MQTQPLTWYAQNQVHDKKQAMAAAYLEGQYTISDIAKVCGVHCTTVSRAVAQNLLQARKI
jgi:transposase-like protein